MNRARRCLTSVIEHKPLSERLIQWFMFLNVFFMVPSLYIFIYFISITHVDLYYHPFYYVDHDDM